MKIKLQEILDNKNISIYSLSKDIGVAQNNLSKIVKGETTSIKYDILEKLCTILDITPNDIFEIEPQLSLFNYQDVNKTDKIVLSKEEIENFNNYIPTDEELEKIQERLNKEYDLGENLEIIVRYILCNTNHANLTSKIKIELEALQKVDSNIPFAFRFILSYRSLYYIVMKQMYNKQLIDFLLQIKRIYTNNHGTFMLSDEELEKILKESKELLDKLNINEKD